jgi:hypothetical protein
MNLDLNVAPLAAWFRIMRVVAKNVLTSQFAANLSSGCYGSGSIVCDKQSSPCRSPKTRSASGVFEFGIDLFELNRGSEVHRKDQPAWNGVGNRTTDRKL